MFWCTSIFKSLQKSHQNFSRTYLMFDRYIVLRKSFEYLIFHLSRFRTLKLRDLICKTHNKNLCLAQAV